MSEVAFAASDGSAVVADLHAAAAADDAPVLLLFHQGGGDARGEYGPIVPRLVASGRHVLAVDLRPASQAQLELFDDLGFTTFVADPGTHGASPLVPERSGGEVEGTWDVTLRFLDEVAPASTSGKG